MIVKAHTVYYLDISPAAAEVLLDTRLNADAVRQLAEQVIANFPLVVADINALYPRNMTVDNRQVIIVSKPRRYRPAEGLVGWGVAVITLDQWMTLMLLPADKANAVLVVALQPDPTHDWLAEY